MQRSLWRFDRSHVARGSVATSCSGARRCGVMSGRVGRALEGALGEAVEGLAGGQFGVVTRAMPWPGQDQQHSRSALQDRRAELLMRCRP